MLREAAEAIGDQCKRLGWSSVVRMGVKRKPFDVVNLAKKLSQEGTEVVFFLGPTEAESEFLEEAEAHSWKPTVLIPGALTGPGLFDAPLSFNHRIFLSYPTLPSDQTSDGVVEYRKLAEAHSLPTQHLAQQLAAFSSAKILVEGLRGTGKNLSREKLIETIEKLYHFQTGFTPPITYSPNRRVGAVGGYIVSLNLEQKRLVPVSKWIEVSSDGVEER